MLKNIKERWNSFSEDFFSVVEVIENKEVKMIKSKDSGLVIIKDLNFKKIEEIFTVYEETKGKFKKREFKGNFFFDGDNDVAITPNTKKEENLLFKLMEKFGIQETMYFMFPMYEKFDKIYPYGKSVYNYKEALRRERLNHIKTFISLCLSMCNEDVNKKYEEIFKKIISNMRIKEAGFTNKKNNFLANFIAFENQFLSPETIKILNLKMFNEIENALNSKDEDIFNPTELFQENKKEKPLKKYLVKEINGDFSIIEKEKSVNELWIDVESEEEVNFFSTYSFLEIGEQVKKFNINFYHVLKYIKSCKDHQYMDVPLIISIYSDYLKMSNDLYRDFEKFPQRLIYSHDKVAKIHRELINFDEWNEGIKKRLENLSFLEGEIVEGYSITLPKNSKDIINEGKALSHCVSGYIKSMAKNKTTILFLRKTENIEKPLYTIELRHGIVVQARGHGNSSLPEELLKNFKEKLNFKIKDNLKKGA